LNEFAPPRQLNRWGASIAHRFERMTIVESQIDTCREYGADYSPPDLDSKLGISDNFFSGELR
jgi:hypothetical protein